VLLYSSTVCVTCCAFINVLGLMAFLITVVGAHIVIDHSTVRLQRVFLNLYNKYVLCYFTGTCIGERHCNYEAVRRGIVGVLGLPPDMVLKHPRLYGQKALRTILDNQDKLKFIG
jgi:GTF2I-like repeat